MILAMDIGNTNIVVGVLDDDKIYCIERLSTNRTKTEVEYAIDLKTVLDICHIERARLEGCIISSVVPQITNVLKNACEKILHKQPLIVGPGIKTGLNIALDNPGEMGADRVADAVAALEEYQLPLVIVDMGTATTISVIDRDRRFVGGVIYPGVRVSLDALTSNASKLNGISIEEPRNLIGRNTVECMQSGVIYGNAAMVDGVVERIEEELGTGVTVIATGGWSGKIIPHCRHEIIRDENLLLKGLLVIYKKNR
jgi:type III pantothenate kinase